MYGKQRGRESLCFLSRSQILRVNFFSYQRRINHCSLLPQAAFCCEIELCVLLQVAFNFPFSLKKLSGLSGCFVLLIRVTECESQCVGAGST